jgi:hypothetical protein
MRKELIEIDDCGSSSNLRLSCGIKSSLISDGAA